MSTGGRVHTMTAPDPEQPTVSPLYRALRLLKLLLAVLVSLVTLLRLLGVT